VTHLQVVRAGALTTVQDLGRPGFAYLGVPRSGAVDQPALRTANHLVGNAAGAAGLETTLTGCALRFDAGALVAVTGAPAAVSVDGREAPRGAAVSVPAGALLEVGSATAGVRSYDAVAGGGVVEPVLGSRSTDTLSGLGPPRLTDGTRLPVGDAPTDLPSVTESAPGDSTPTGDPRVRLRAGPRDDWFTPGALEVLASTAWTVSSASNRVAARLDGPALERAVDGELPSEGLVLGAVQVPSDGRPLVFLADHPTTGGYPVIAVVEPEDVPLVAQSRPGALVRCDLVG
jgi:biotin-dependent carboxylase-like uncharacterized protein